MVGVANTLVQQGLYLIIVSFEFHILFSQIIGLIVTFCVSFILNESYTYPVPVPLTKRLFYDFIMGNLPSYVTQLVVLLVIVGGLVVPKMMALLVLQLSQSPFLFMFLNQNRASRIIKSQLVLKYLPEKTQLSKRKQLRVNGTQLLF